MDKEITNKFKKAVFKSISLCFTFFSIGSFLYFSNFDFVDGGWRWAIVVCLEMIAVSINTIIDD